MSSASRRSTGAILGLWQQLPLPMISRYLAQMGWDWLILDGQHGCFNYETIYECVHAIRAAGCKALVRVSVGNPGEVEKVLDLGAQGVIVPMVKSPEEAERVAQAAKYPPLGCRSFGGDSRFHYGESYPERANAETVLVVQVEHIRSVRSVREILSIPGVDGCFVGPTDLALSMGLSRFNYEKNDDYREAVGLVAETCRSLEKLACCNSYSLADAEDKLALGFQCITLKSDADLFIGAATQLLNSLREKASGSAEP